MDQVKQGDTVRVHYVGRLADGEEFDSSANEEPLEFTLGAGDVIAGFEQAALGMTPGENKTTVIPADLAYGAYDEELVLVMAREDLPEGIEPTVGQHFQMRQEDGEAFEAVVAEVDDETVTLDANHPLAGQDLTFDIALLEIN